MIQSTYLVEYKMLWAGKVVREGIEEIRTNFDWDAGAEVKKMLLTLNKKADIRIGEIVLV